MSQGTTNGDANDESVMNVDAEDDVDNLQLAWEMLGNFYIFISTFSPQILCKT